ncbi:MAG TPA: hypothetical protein VHZ06_01545 [Marmoricola sp.]|jgi:hypothetical protein|nr:hypothetical protein [Marmoricola sp.]
MINIDYNKAPDRAVEVSGPDSRRVRRSRRALVSLFSLGALMLLAPLVE